MVTFFYFDSTDPAKKDLRGFLVSTLIQLFSQSDPCYKVFRNLYTSHRSGLELPNNEVLEQCLKEMLTLPMLPTVYLIMDALDECPNDSWGGSRRDRVLDLVEDLVGLHLPNLRICVTSHLEADIEFVLKPLVSFTVSLHDEEGQKQSIVDFIEFTVRTNYRMRSWSVDIKKLVVDTLSQKADGRYVILIAISQWCSSHHRFRWVSSKLGALSSRLPMDIPRALKNLE